MGFLRIGMGLCMNIPVMPKSPESEVNVCLVISILVTALTVCSAKYYRSVLHRNLKNERQSLGQKVAQEN